MDAALTAINRGYLPPGETSLLDARAEPVQGLHSYAHGHGKPLDGTLGRVFQDRRL